MSSALLIKLHRKHDLTRLWVRRVYRVTYRGERKVPSCDNYTSPNPIVALRSECHTFVGGVQKFAVVSRIAIAAVLRGIVFMRLEVLMTGSVTVIACWGATLCRLGSSSLRFEGS